MATVLHAHPDFGVDGTYTPDGGSAVTVRAILVPHDPALQLQGASVRSQGWQADLLVAEVPIRPAEGDLITVGAESYRIRSVEQDAARTSWRCDVDRVIA